MRDLGVNHAAAIVVGTIIGGGIFLVPTEMMQAVGSAKLVYAVWIVGGLLSFFGAVTYAELGAMKPYAGGEYVYIRDGYGPLAGFLDAWAWFLIAKPASIASVTTGIMRVLGTFHVFSFFSSKLTSTPFPITYGQLVAIAATIFISLLNYVGVKKAGEFQFISTLLKIAMILDQEHDTFGLEYDDTRGTKNMMRLDALTYEKAILEARSFLGINDNNQDADGDLWEVE